MKANKEQSDNSLRHQPITNPKYEEGAFYVAGGMEGETCPVVIDGYAATNCHVADLLNEWNAWIIELLDFKKNTLELIDNRIKTLKDNGEQCRCYGNHDKGMEFISQAELLARLKKDLEE